MTHAMYVFKYADGLFFNVHLPQPPNATPDTCKCVSYAIQDAIHIMFFTPVHSHSHIHGQVVHGLWLGWWWYLHPMVSNNFSHICFVVLLERDVAALDPPTHTCLQLLFVSPSPPSAPPVTFALTHILLLSWRVENSHGVARGKKGYIIMSNEWFDEFLYQVDTFTCYTYVLTYSLTHSLTPRDVDSLIHSPTHRGRDSLELLVSWGVVRLRRTQT